MQIQISWLLQKPTDLDLHCLQSQGISGFSRFRVKYPKIKGKYGTQSYAFISCNPLPGRKLWKGKCQTRGPWWSYIAHLSKQLCKLTVEVSANFTALRFLYKFYSPTPERLCFFHASWLLELNLERRSPKEQFCRYIEIGPVVSDKKIFEVFYIAI